MPVRSIILGAIALFLAVTTALLARSWLADQKLSTAEAAPPVIVAPVRSVMIARAAITRGQILRADDFTWQPWPDGRIDAAYIQSNTKQTDAFAGWVAKEPLSAGEPVIESKIIAPNNRGFLAAVLRPGMRAVSVPVTATSGISGFVFPGDQVDILITHPLPSDGGSGGSGIERKAAETVLSDVRVIAVDQKLESKPGEATIAHTATLEVTPKQSEVVALATQIGQLSLSLRSLTPPEASGAAIDPKLSTFTLDSEVSRLMRSSVTVLRGNGAKSTGDSSLMPQQPQVARGS